MNLSIQTYLDSFLCLAFPRLCISCSHEQAVKNDSLCVSCRVRLPYCEFTTLDDNLLHWRLGSRLVPTWASSFLYFKSGNQVQRILHALKYEGRQDIGEQFGEEHAKQIQSAQSFHVPDIIIPVPLHPKKLHQRGYNQSYSYAKGLGAVFGSKVSEGLLLRKRHTSSQTNKSKLERLNNVQDAFALSGGHNLEGASILLVDDVFTSGATLEACAQPFMSIKDVRLSIATLAIADDW